jgi:hypothetical protein
MSILNLSLEMNNGVKNLMVEMVSKAVRYCGEVKNFDAEEMLRLMNVYDMSVSVSVSVDKKSKKSLALAVKSKMPMPFSGKVKENCCGGLRQNHGLYTQCETVVKDEKYCKKCGENPEYGTIQQRLEVGLMEFRDPKGKAPTHFTKVMKKLKISREEVEEEASKLNIIINDIHFEEEKVEKKEKGRPKKPKRRIELADDSTDLFAALVAKANEESEESGSSSSSEDDNSSIAETIIDSVLDKVSVIAENNEKEALKQAEKEALKQAEKEKKEAEKEALKQAEKEKKEAEKEALKQAEKEKKEEEKLKKEAEKAEKEALKQAEIQKKEALKQTEIQKKAEKEAEKLKKEAEKAEKEALKLAEKLKKEEEKLKKESTQASKVVKSKKESVEPVVVAEKKASKAAVKEVEEQEEDVVKRFEFEGVKYLKSKKTGIIYNMDQDVIGKWNEKTGKIDFEEAGSEEEEEEYDE